MTGIIVIGHGCFGTGLASAAELILGKQENFLAIDFQDGDTKTELESKVQAALGQFEDAEHLLIFCDLLSGSPFNAMTAYTMGQKHSKVVYGTNLGMLVETLMNRNLGADWEELISELILSGKDLVGMFFPKDDTEEEKDEDWD